MSADGNEATPLVSGFGAEAVGDGVYIVRGQGNSFAAETDHGLVVVDAGPGGAVTQGMIESLRDLSDAPLHALCYSHGHGGYNAGVDQWIDHARERGDPAPRLVAHRNLPRRYARYRATQSLQNRINEVQFRRKPGSMDANPRLLHDPTELFDERLVIGERRRVELLWGPSETDDAIAVWCPQQRLLYGGPTLIDSIPNVGTPLRTLRDPVRWAATLERLAALGPERAVREFGPMIDGADEVQRVLLHTAGALRWLHAEVVRLLNQGLGEREILATIRYPEEWFGVPWMKPSYGDPSFIVRDIYRSENGWWDRNPTSLHPAPPAEVAAALAEAIADKAAVIAQARKLEAAGRLQLALHVIDLLALAAGGAPEIAAARQLKADWLRRRADQVPSYVSKSLYLASADAVECGDPSHFSIH